MGEDGKTINTRAMLDVINNVIPSNKGCGLGCSENNLTHVPNLSLQYYWPHII
jgi:hypothetical protein